MNIILMGPPGSGKSTQAELLANKLGVPHLQTGEIYRQMGQQDSDVGRKIKATIDSGNLIDDETTFQVVDRHLSENKDGFVLDGFPRTLVQAQEDLFVIDKVIYLSLPDKEAGKRLSKRAKEESRTDNTEEVTGKRLQLFHQETQPILAYYRNLGKLVEIDGSDSIKEISQDIVKALNLA